MKAGKMLGTAVVLGSLLVGGVASAAEEKEDPRVGKSTYHGSGRAESAPEYGEAWFTFSVRCKSSAEEVRNAIENVSGKIWNTIVKTVPRSYTETERTYWGNIQNISEQPGSVLQSTPPRPGRAADGSATVISGEAKRIDVCTGKQLPLDAKVPSMYVGAQRFGVRTANMDWLEGLVRAVSEMSQSQAPDAVKVSASGIQYSVTEATKREMLEETLAEAREEAVGAGSKFASDVKNLKFAEAFFLGHQVAYPPVYYPAIGSPVARGEAPKVTLQLPMTYTIYAEAGNVLDATGAETKGIESEYEIQGTAVVDADFATTSVTVSASCLDSKEAAVQAIEPTADAVLQTLRSYHGGRQASETDRVVNSEASGPHLYYPYEPVEWDETNPRFPATKYLNTCTGEVVAAPESGNRNDLGGYWQISRTLGLRSSDFSRLLGYTEQLQTRYAVATTRQDVVRVSVSDAVADVTDETKRKLEIAAREDATACVISEDGPLAAAAQAHNYTCAYLKDIRVGSPQPKSRGAMLRSADAAMEAAPAGAAAADELAVEVVTKPNEERPVFRMVRHYAFDYQFKTENYLPYLGGEEAEEGEQEEEAPETLVAPPHHS